jgi:branched-chain amino acid transport system permease protein/neutral amino acid transport system permease protein
MEDSAAADPSEAKLGARGLGLRSRPAFSAILFLILVLFWMLGWARGSSFGDLLSLTVWGVMLGGIVALGAIGLTLVYGILKFPNFAHGALITIGAYTALAVATRLPAGPPLTPLSFGWELMAALVVALPVVAVVALVVDAALFRPLRRRGASLVLFAMASLAATFLLQSVIYLIWGSDFRFYYPGRANPALELPLGIRVQADQIFVFVLALVLVGLTWLLLERTKMGKAMRATSPRSAASTPSASSPGPGSSAAPWLRPAASCTRSPRSSGRRWASSCSCRCSRRPSWAGSAARWAPLSAPSSSASPSRSRRPSSTPPTGPRWPSCS